MAREETQKTAPQAESGTQRTVVDAIRHVGPTLEAEGTFLPSGQLPENRIENEGMTDAADIRAVTEDQYDREANAMGAERLQTRLPGDTSSDPHTDSVADNATTMDRGEGPPGRKHRAA